MAPWIAVVGRSAQGANELITALVEKCRNEGLSVGGVRQVPVLKEGERIGYDAISLSTGERLPLARITADADKQDLCDLRFESDAFGVVEQWVCREKWDVNVLPVGPLERRKQGYWPTITKLRSEGRGALVLLIRPDVLTSVVLGMDDPIDGVELPAGDAELARLVGAMVAARKAGQ